MVQLPGFEASDKTLVCCVHKTHYGLKQALHALHERLIIALFQFGFSINKCEPSFFIYSKGTTLLIGVVYVAVILIGSSPSLISDVIHKLNASFALRELDALDYFLGIKSSTSTPHLVQVH